jgi:hypothetical protein
MHFNWTLSITYEGQLGTVSEAENNDITFMQHLKLFCDDLICLSEYPTK